MSKTTDVYDRMKAALNEYPHIVNTGDHYCTFKLLTEFLLYLQERNYTGRTIDTRAKSLLMFAEWSGQRQLLRPTEITKPILERYQRYLFNYRKANGEPLSFRSQLSHLVSVRTWFKWLTQQNYLPSNPASELQLPRIPKTLPKSILTVAEVESALNTCDSETVAGLRDRAMLEVLYSTGIRRQELVGLRMEDINYELGTLFIRNGKGQKERIVPIGDRAIAWVEKYRNESRPELNCGRDGGMLFLNRFGEGFGVGSITTMVRQYLDKANVTKPGSAHLFRHTMATLMLENGADIRFIQAMLGHAKLESTEVYTRVSIKKLKSVHEMTHPAKLKSSTKGDLDNVELLTENWEALLL